MVFCCQCWPVHDAIQYQYTTDAQENVNVLIVFTHADLKKATNNFNQSSKIGEGRFGSVHMGTIKSLKHPYNDIQVAAKRVKRGQKEQRQWAADMKLIGKIKHPNLVRLIGYCETKRNWILVYEYMPNGSLKDHLSVKSNIPLSWDTRLKIARDAATGLLHLHSGLHQRIVFGNFKPSNILLDSHMNAKLSDFGFSNESPQEGGTNVSTSVVGYAAPEYVKTGHLTSKIDIWSFGAFLEELITGGRPLTQENGEKNPECLTWVCCYAGARKSIDPRLEGEYSENSMRMVASVANKCLANDPELRPGMTEVLKLLKEAISLQTKNQQLLKSKCWPDLATHVC